MGWKWVGMGWLDNWYNPLKCSGYSMQHQEKHIKEKTLLFCQWSVFMCFLRFSEQSAIVFWRH